MADDLEVLLGKELKRQIDAMERKFQRVTDKWEEGDQPAWEKKLDQDVRDVVAEIRTDSTPFVFVSAGVPKRSWAVFSQDYRPRTKRHSLHVGPKRGKVLARGKRQIGGKVPPKKPIEAREFEVEVARLQEPLLLNALSRALETGTRRAFGRGGKTQVTLRL